MRLTIRIVVGVVLLTGACAPIAARAAATVETFESFPENTVLTTQIPGLSISTPTGQPLIRPASTPLIPGQPNGLAHFPYNDFPAYLNIDFAPTTNTVGALIDIGVVGSGIRLTAYAGPGQTGSVLGTISTTTETTINVNAAGIRSARFETLSADASYLIDNLTYELVPEPASMVVCVMGTCGFVLATRRRIRSRRR